MVSAKLVTLSLGNGDLYRGFETVTVRLSQPNELQPMQFIGALPAQPELADLYRQWKVLYSALLQRLNRSTRIEVASEGTTNVSESEFDELCEKLSLAINYWLNTGSFRDVSEKLRTELSKTDEIRFLIETSDNLLQRLPWHLWNFFEAYPKAEVGISTTEYRQAKPLQHFSHSKVRILAILGSSEGIDLNRDWETLNQFSRQGKAEVKTLYQPKLDQLNEQLWQPGWDILFFAGHSFSEKNGILRINQDESISLDKLKNALRTAIERGLKLAIFNSCDGIGLAQSLFDLHIPQVIVMREEVPDVVAHQFLPNFLVAFFAGKSLFVAVREARERLEQIQNTYPCATWLPVIYQNPAAAPLLLPTPSPKLRFRTVALVSVIVAGLCTGIRQIGAMEFMDLWAFDHLMRLRPAEATDARLLTIEITDADIRYQQQRQMIGQGTLSDQALQSLLEKLEPLQPRVIGIDIYRDFKVDDQFPKLAQQLQKDDRIISVCRTSDPTMNVSGTPPSPEVPLAQIGFSDVATGKDQVVRSHLLYMTPDVNSPCRANQAFSLQLALTYLEYDNILNDSSDQKTLKISKTIFTPLSESRRGGYRSLDLRGYQILLNYRRPIDKISRTITLAQALEEPIDPTWVKDKIILIGVTSENVKDDHLTPLSTDKPLPRGLTLQAQMVSHILSAVLDKRPLLWVWPDWGENIWIFGWSILGGVLIWGVRSPFLLSLSYSGILLSQLFFCWLTLVQGGWIPLVPAALVFVVTPISALAISKKWR
jgi:CHASE2 domain-containing sensor protein